MSLRRPPIIQVTGVSHAVGILAQELLSPFAEGLSRMDCRLGRDDNSLAIYQLAATIFSDAIIKIWEQAA